LVGFAARAVLTEKPLSVHKADCEKVIAAYEARWVAEREDRGRAGGRASGQETREGGRERGREEQGASEARK
jgi:hypothetical protein